MQALVGLAQPAAPALRGRQLGRQLVAAGVTEPFVFLSVDGVGLGEALARDLLAVARGLRRPVGGDLRAVDGNHPDADQPRLGAKRENLAEQLGQRRLVPLTEAGDRRVSGIWFAQITLVATSSTQRRSSRRDDRSPIA